MQKIEDMGPRDLQNVRMGSLNKRSGQHKAWLNPLTPQNQRGNKRNINDLGISRVRNGNFAICTTTKTSTTTTTTTTSLNLSCQYICKIVHSELSRFNSNLRS
jgi:hypothetical protein